MPCPLHPRNACGTFPCLTGTDHWTAWQGVSQRRLPSTGTLNYRAGNLKHDAGQPLWGAERDSNKNQGTKLNTTWHTYCTRIHTRNCHKVTPMHRLNASLPPTYWNPTSWAHCEGICTVGWAYLSLLDSEGCLFWKKWMALWEVRYFGLGS